jgi:hypothetical protein
MQFREIRAVYLTITPNKYPFCQQNADFVNVKAGIVILPTGRLHSFLVIKVI